MKLAKVFKFLILIPFQSSPSPAIFVTFCFRITPLVFFFLTKPFFLTEIKAIEKVTQNIMM